MTTLTEGIAAYRTIARADGKSDRTVEWVCSSTRYLSQFLGPNIAMEEITPYDLRRWVAALRDRRRFAGHPSIRSRDRPLSATAINDYVRGVKLLFSTLSREGVIPDHAITRFKAPKVPKLTVRPYTEEQLRGIFRALEKTANPLRNRAMTALLLDSCLRLTEMATLKAEALDLEARELRILGKGTKERVVPIGAWAAKQLLLYRLKERPDSTAHELFLGSDGAPLRPHGFQQVLERIGRRLGFRVYAHAFRHTGAILYVRNGGAPLRLQQLLGHADLAMTRRYCAIADSDLREAHRKYSPGIGLGCRHTYSG